MIVKSNLQIIKLLKNQMKNYSYDQMIKWSSDQMIYVSKKIKE